MQVRHLVFSERIRTLTQNLSSPLTQELELEEKCDIEPVQIKRVKIKKVKRATLVKFMYHVNITFARDCFVPF